MLLIDAPSSAHLSAPRKEHAPMDGTRYATRAVVRVSQHGYRGWLGRSYRGYVSCCFVDERSHVLGSRLVGWLGVLD